MRGDSKLGMQQQKGRGRQGDNRSSRSVSETVGQVDGISARVPIRNAPLGGVVRGGLNEWFKDPVRLSEVVMNDVHEE